MSNFFSPLLLRAGALALTIVGCSVQQLQAAEAPGTYVIGDWKLTAVLDSSDITALDDREAANLVGHIFKINRDKIQLDERVCDAPSFEVTKAETNSYFRREAHASADKLGLPNPVTSIELNCTYVYPKSRNRLVVHWKGFFFDAIRMPSKAL
nr:hypothetical protein [uncultured Duganella sp.]